MTSYTQPPVCLTSVLLTGGWDHEGLVDHTQTGLACGQAVGAYQYSHHLQCGDKCIINKYSTQILPSIL